MEIFCAKERRVKIVGYRKGKEYAITTDDPQRLEAFANMMERTEYITTSEEKRK
jgi:hypothetical protein